MTHTRRSRIAIVIALAAAAVAGCKGKESAPAPTKETAKPPGELTVFAASSLREAFLDLEQAFSAAHPDVQITFNFAGTQELRAQIEHGAAVDVFAAADSKHMKELATAGAVVDPVVFARNEPVVVVARDRAAALTAFADLPKAARIVIGVPDVPIGRYTDQILGNAGSKLGAAVKAAIEAKIVSRELNVRQVLAKVSLGEADAGIVYRTDAVTAADKVAVVAIPPEINVVAEYPIAVLKAAPNTALAHAWLALVLSAAGQELLTKRGFLPAAAVAAAGGTQQTP